MEREFSVDEARELMPEVRERVTAIIAARRDVALLADGPTAERKGAEARLAEEVEWFVRTGVQVKGIAPVVLDFPGRVDGEPALLCWLEGETDLVWFHRPEHGFMGRQELP
ncbi:MAG: DUF2203 domain-containing protein [Egibacteraceae bacterium]